VTIQRIDCGIPDSLFEASRRRRIKERTTGQGVSQAGTIEGEQRKESLNNTKKGGGKGGRIQLLAREVKTFPRLCQCRRERTKYSNMPLQAAGMPAG